MTEIQDLLEKAGLTLEKREEGLTLSDGKMEMRGDFPALSRRIDKNRLQSEMIVKAVRIKRAEGVIRVVDATAGLGEDSFLLAAAGFEVTLFEKDPVISLLLEDSILRAGEDPKLCDIAKRMSLVKGDSIEKMKELPFVPDVVFLDPMFPERQKSGLIKKKFQLLQKLETPCNEEEELLQAAIDLKPKKIVIKRPQKGPYLAGRKPDYFLDGKAIRYDCLVFSEN